MFLRGAMETRPFLSASGTVAVDVEVVVEGTVKRARSWASVSRMRETMSVEWRIARGR